MESVRPKRGVGDPPRGVEDQSVRPTKGTVRPMKESVIPTRGAQTLGGEWETPPSYDTICRHMFRQSLRSPNLEFRCTGPLICEVIDTLLDL